MSFSCRSDGRKDERTRPRKRTRSQAGNPESDLTDCQRSMPRWHMLLH